jgi:transposase InsO family protein
MKTLKQEEIDGRPYRDTLDARGSIGTFIEEVYNRQRLHSALAYRAPIEFEETLRPEPIVDQTPVPVTTASGALAGV